MRRTSHCPVFNTLKALHFNQRSIHGCFFGSGAAPEITAWVTDLKNRFPNVEYAEAHTYDISADAWAFSRKITEQCIAPSCWNGQLLINAENIDLCSKHSMRQIRSIEIIIGLSNLFVIQNCLNELAVEPDGFISNLNFLLKHMSNYSVLVVADFSQYNSVINLKKRIEGYVRKIPGFSVLRSHTEGARELFSSLEIPEIITTNLLTGEDCLKPKSKVQYNYFIAQKISGYGIHIGRDRPWQ